MRRLFVDTNILLDLLAKREPFYHETAQLFSAADSGKVELFTSALSFANIHYVLSQRLKQQDAKNAISRLMLLVKPLDLNELIIQRALSDDSFSDFEDALQYFTAIENKSEAIITRNLKDFKNAALPVLTAGQMCSLL